MAIAEWERRQEKGDPGAAQERHARRQEETNASALPRLAL